MPDLRDVQSVMQAAEQAADGGDYASAREYLRHAISLQEASVGPTHPVLANALNNLGVIYEREDKLAEAEACYRRAYAIASAALEPDHPFVVMSARNLQEFCEARGLPFNESAGSPTSHTPPPAHPAGEPPPFHPAIPTAGPAPPLRTAADDSHEPGSRHPVAAVRTASSRSSASHAVPMGRLVMAGLLLGVLIAVGVIAVQSRSNASVSQPRVASAPAHVRPKLSAEARNVHPRRDAAPEQIRRPAAVAPARVAGSAPTIAAAGLCRTLQLGGGWRCAPATGTLQPGVVFFYTRLLSPIDTTVEHRWYSGEHVHQTVTLRVHANQSTGYRTYSQMTVSPARAHDWRVELRAADGMLLHEERFAVGQ
jgi:hypothetical protein